MISEQDIEFRFRQIVEEGKQAHERNKAAVARAVARLDRIAEDEEREREFLADLDPVNRLYWLVSQHAGTFGESLTNRMAVNMVFAGNAAAGGVVVRLAGLDTIPLLVAADATPAALRAAIQTALLFYHKELPGFIARNGGRAAFASWCRQARFSDTVPATLPEVVEIFRGTMGVSPAVAASGLHWADSFGMACFHACRFCDEYLTGVIVLKAEVHRSDLVAFIGGIGENELTPAASPTVFETITDHELIREAAHRASKQYEAHIANGAWYVPTRGFSERAAMATRARMAAAGVVPGTAIVA